MQKIKLKDLKVYAYHGCMEEEAKIGSYYLVNLTIWLKLKKAGKSDHLEDTINYGELSQIIKDQMAIRSHLLENVALRILSQIKKQFHKIKKAKVSVSKVNPPVNADINYVKVSFKKKF